jgi:hypothetical protein
LPGVVYDNAFTTPKRIVNFMNAEKGTNLFALDGAAVRQYVPNLDNFVMPRSFLSELISSVDLPSPVTKESDDVLRVTYQYRLL